MALQTFNALGLIPAESSNLQNMMRTELENSFNRVRNKYAEPNAQLGIQKQQLENKYYGPDKEASIALNKAHAGYFGAQSRSSNIDAKKQQMIMDIIQQALRGDNGGQNMQPLQSQQPPQRYVDNDYQMQGEGMNGQISQDRVRAPASAPLSQQGLAGASSPNGDNNYLARAIAAHAMGIPQPNPQITGAGEIVSFDPITGKPTVRQGLKTPGEVAEMTESGKLMAQDKEKILNEIDASYAKEPIFQELQSIINSPEFYQGVGPVMSRLAKLTDNPGVNAVVGNIDTLLGGLVNESFKQFGARGNQSEYKAMQKIKGSSSDNPYSLRSKIMLMNALDKYNREVNVNYYKNLQTMPRLEAKEKAVQSANYSEVKKVIKLDDMAHKAAQNHKSDYGAVMAAAQRYSQETGVPLEDALRVLGEKRGK